jgi:trehalose synthase
MVMPVWECEPRSGEPRLLHVNATAAGGGVAELLRGLVRGQRAAGVNAGWAVIGGTAGFYDVTKYLHHLLHGRADPARLADPEPLRTYREVLVPQAAWFDGELGPGDVVVLHDPQTLGLAPALRATGARVVWHCHVGAVVGPERGPGAVWRELAAELAAVHAVVTTRPEFAPPAVPVADRVVAPPAVDPAAAKNRELTASEVAAQLDAIGLTAATGTPGGLAQVTQDAPVPPGAAVVLQVSRWDPLKDMPAVLRTVESLPPDVHVVLAGADPTEIPDDREAPAVFAEVLEALAGLSPRGRARAHLVSISQRSPEAGALLVNALQRRADVVVQKSLEEGFGLTVTEAMLKGRAVVASDVGGLRTQITHGHDGVLVDPADHAQLVAVLRALLDDPARRAAMGARARASVLARHTMDRLVADYARVATPGPRRAAALDGVVA